MVRPFSSSKTTPPTHTHTHNLIEIRNSDEFHEFCTIWKAFGNPGSVTLLLTGQATNLKHDGIKTQKTIFRGKWGSQVEQVGLLRLGDAAKCPWNKAMTQVPREKIPVVSKCTVRIMAPEGYRKVFLRKDDSPMQVISDVASQAETQVSQLTGGTWSHQKFGNRKQLVGHLRLNDTTANKVVATSGKQGVFCTKISKDSDTAPKPKVFWMTKLADEDQETYYRRCLTLGQTRKQHLILRPGGGADIGFVWQTQDQEIHKPKVYDFHGVPLGWDSSEIMSLVTDVGWSNPVVLSRKRKGQVSCWRIRSTPPMEKKDEGSWTYSVDDVVPWTLNVLLAPPKAAKAVSSWVQAPRRTFGQFSAEEFPVLDNAQKAKPGEKQDLGKGSQSKSKEKGKGEASERGRSRSPMRTQGKDVKQRMKIMKAKKTGRDLGKATVTKPLMTV